MKRKISITQKLLLFVSVFFILAVSGSWFFISSVKEFDKYAEISSVMSSIKGDVAEMEYVLDIFVIGGYYKGEGGIEGIYEKAALIDKQMENLQGLARGEVISNNPMLYGNYKTIVSNWKIIKEKTSILNTATLKENAFLIHNDIDLKTFLIKNQLDKSGELIGDARAKFISNAAMLVVKSLIVSLFIALIALYIFYRKAIKPIKDMAAAAEKMEGSNPGVRFEADSGDEIGILASTLNKLADTASNVHIVFEKKILDKTKELESRTRELIALNRIANSIGRTFAYDEILGIAMNELLLMSGSNTGWIYLVEPNSNDSEEKLILRVHKGMPHTFVREFKEVGMEEAAMGQPIKGRGHIFANITEMDSKFRPFMNDMGIEAVCMIPIIYADNIVGIINLACKKHNIFANEYCLFGEAVAAEVAVAIENINLFQRERKSKQFMEKIIYQSPISTTMVDKDGVCIMINSACKRLFGIKEDGQIIGRYNILKDNVLDEMGYIPLLNRAFKGESVDMEIEYDISKVEHIQVKGRPRRFKVKAFPILDNDGSVINVVIMHEDMSKKEQFTGK
ncbi:MAG: hypothetical protein A3G39_03270 [Deltaproteobacteria bacterium RIFCSPLOWO2_12_FULL_43_16]|nr:MAG: hypothetical protein A2Z89_06745 [Deltaproteobacteria bacterium GWA2_43_19]OGQ10409.1 MAG: hypothetical protein A3D30_08825 [Deltaproteobacteria bacterium RIFCSPHIGHO2_02_FULL_43_33]OGQ59233.1 MAG: hypothetical protein A3G39_03270 [Deltaproteobacteria bacterium RIFCSPLOWO2_12_FULL_43_16]